MSARVIATAALLRAVGATWRLEFDETQVELARPMSRHGNVIYAFWHHDLGVLAYTHRHRGAHALVSQHRDGAWIAGVLERLGHGLVRGSSRRGGTEALFQLAQVLEAGHDVSIAVDGPIGPRHTVHAGALLLARRTGVPILPGCVTMDRGLRLRTWDQLQLPACGARVRVRFGPAHLVSETATGEELAAAQQRLEDSMRAATLEAEARFGRSIDLDDVQDRRSYWERRSEMASPPAVLRGLARVHAVGRGIERRLRPRPAGRGGRPWVVGVGNLEAGGTGKTPVVLDLARTFTAAGFRVAILLRGHGGALGVPPVHLVASDLVRASDETRLYAAALGDTPIVVARDRNAGLDLLRQDGALDLVLVDDAFQTAGLPVDRHLVLLDATSPLGNGWLLPAGRLRQPAAALAGAQVLLFTRATTGEIPRHAAWEAHRRAGRVFIAREEIARLHTHAGEPVDPETLRGVGVASLCGIGRPRGYETALRAYGARWGFHLRRAVRVGDHAPLETALRKLTSRLEGLGCKHVVVTQKDACRLGPEWKEPLLVAEQRLLLPERASLAAALAPDHYSVKLATLTDNDTGT